MLSFSPKKYLSHLLIIISVVISCIGFVVPTFQNTYGFSGATWYTGNYSLLVMQIILFQFLHANIIHLLFNMYFLYMVGPEVEARMSRERFFVFFVVVGLVVALGLQIFENPFVITIGISGFCMALMSYLWIDLFTTRHPLANQIGIILIVNVAFGLFSGISFYGHLFGAIIGIIWWIFRGKTSR